MTPRFRLFALITALLLAACSESPELQRFRAGIGETHHAIELGGELRGRIRELRSLDSAGRPRIRSETELVLPGNAASRRTETLIFSAEPPHPLLEHRIHHQADGRDHRRRPVPGERTLGSWLDEPAAGAGGEWRRDGDWLRARRDDGARLALQLDAEGGILEYRIGDAFRMRRMEHAPELPPAEPEQTLGLPVTGTLGRRGSVDALTLRITGPAASLLENGTGLDVRRDGAASLLRSTRTRAATDPDTRRLVQGVLTRVRQRLDYVPGAAPPDLDALLETGEGDCWEFAALFEALAERVGLDSRTVTGLAWTGDESGRLALHAWNEVRVEDRWQAVDPTWNQAVADAARIRFPDDPSLQLDLQMALADSRLELVSVNGVAAEVGGH
jgi:transglutaminase-like putative cysteine protease